MRRHAFHKMYDERLAAATKPFNARGAKVIRCKQCQIAEQYCICEHQPAGRSDFAVLLLVSDAEILKPSNTGRLILDTVEEGYAFPWHRTEPNKELLALLNDKTYQPVVIFPEDYVDDKTRLIQPQQFQPPGGKKLLFIFLDGSWREARRMFRKSPYLDGYPVCSIKPETLSNYMMRKSEHEDHLATAEVASIVFEQFGAAQTSQVLAQWFSVFRESYMLSKTRFSSDLSRPALNNFKGLIKNANSV
ncbi:tRNA-uridine aminocarboxypropyltransferase [Vibrio hangzhouensis]|uniref:tRNA-uridine aminocarboxypropyltransferase n=1 Tax=Vibrio hangzhouensis TaxID=462991 RepID=UPI001C964900|nr:tRNA-uridine aminocarboxypropyltransferase [Vibrio hangzhouensis]MBY6196664.1 DTW domain-containing protein [Vibrio hangzhouensis]